MTWKRPDEDRPRHGQLVLMRGPQGGLFLGRFVGDTDTARTNDSMCRRRCAWWQEIPEENMQMKVKLDRGAYLPERAHATDAGLDLRTPCDVHVPPHGYAIIDTGVHIELPKGHFAQVTSKSGLNVRKNITTTGTIDEGYTGSIVVKLYNHGPKDVRFERGDKIAQMVILPYVSPSLVVTDELGETERGDNGFGSTGR
ncbi:MAG: dUTP diphosphatase [Parafannyhessea umbonata]|nr:dUTP diphosphatase [Parafannyhessea umbonata]